jgi:hypothetical protein
MIGLIWYLSVTMLSYLLGTLTNSKLNLLHDRSNLVLICYNPILSIRNSNKLKTKSVTDLIWFLYVRILSYLLGTLTNSKPNEKFGWAVTTTTVVSLLRTTRDG